MQDQPLFTDADDVGGADRSSVRRRSANVRGRRKRRALKVLLVAALVAAVTVVGVAGLLVTKGQSVTHKVFSRGSILDLIGSGTPLRTDGHGRTNIVLLGTSQDDASHVTSPGGAGLWLTDSIQVVSLDQKTKRVTMIAVPRDLWVQMPAGCVVGSHARINAVYECASGLVGTGTTTPPDYRARDARGAAGLMASITTVTGLTPQYYIHVDYSVLRDSVNALGGVNVDIVGDGASGIRDTNLDAHTCTTIACARVYYPHNGVYHLSGTRAMNLARARADTNPRSGLDFGLSRGDFDREANQQKIMVAIKDKAISAGTLANPLTVFNLLSALGDNVTMSLSAGEAKSLISFTRAIPTGGMNSLSLTLGTAGVAPVLTTGMAGSQDVVVPTAGEFDYGAVRAFVAAHLTGTPAGPR